MGITQKAKRDTPHFIIICLFRKHLIARRSQSVTMATSSPIKIATIYIHINLDFGRNAEVVSYRARKTNQTTTQQEFKCVHTYGTETGYWQVPGLSLYTTSFCSIHISLRTCWFKSVLVHEEWMPRQRQEQQQQQPALTTQCCS